MTGRGDDTRWRARTVAIDDPGPLADYLAGPDSIAWLRRGEGVVGLGVAASASVSSLDEGNAWWSDLAARIDHDTEVPGAWGSGPLAFGSFAFDPATSPDCSVVVVPRVLIGRQGSRSWLTVLHPAGEAPKASELPQRHTPTAPSYPVIDDSPEQQTAWAEQVAHLVRRLADAANPLEKVVLARGVRVRTSAPLDTRAVVERLAERYPTCWTFQLDGLVGASPEMLVRRQNGLVTSRVLAGTIRRRSGDAVERLASTLAQSDKDLVEHELAVASVAEALAPYCHGMNVPEVPYVLELPNVMHLASDVTAGADAHASSLQLAARLHPSAAVCGTPTTGARAEIAAIEGLDRGRYSGPVGWIDTAGDGEWAIALRCGQVDAADPAAITLYAGCGIVAASDPASELAETHAKLQPMLQALGVTAGAAGS